MSYSMQEQLRIGSEGAARVKSLLARRFGTLIDYEGNKDMQRQGVDIHIEPWGNIEIKTDLHDSENFFLEYRCSDKPSGIMTGEADWWAYYYPALKRIYLLPVSRVRKYIKTNMKWFATKFKKQVKSHEGDRNWSALGLALPRDYLCAAAPVVVYEDFKNKLWLVAGREPKKKKEVK